MCSFGAARGPGLWAQTDATRDYVLAEREAYRFTRGPGHRHRSNATTTTLARPGLDNIELNKAENVTFVCIAGDTGFGLFRLFVGGGDGHLLTGIVDPARTEMGFLFLCPGCCNWSVLSSSALFSGIAKPFVVAEVDGVFISSLEQQATVSASFVPTVVGCLLTNR